VITCWVVITQWTCYKTVNICHQS